MGLACRPEAAEATGLSGKDIGLARQADLNSDRGSTTNSCDTEHITQPLLRLHVPIYKTETELPHRDIVGRK